MTTRVARRLSIGGRPRGRGKTIEGYSTVHAAARQPFVSGVRRSRARLGFSNRNRGFSVGAS